jgi:hypothetical protein
MVVCSALAIASEFCVFCRSVDVGGFFSTDSASAAVVIWEASTWLSVGAVVDGSCCSALGSRMWNWCPRRGSKGGALAFTKSKEERKACTEASCEPLGLMDGSAARDVQLARKGLGRDLELD